MNKNLIFVNDENENAILNKLYSLLDSYKNTSIEFLSKQMNFDLNLKSQKRKFVELIFEKNNLLSDLHELTNNHNYVLRTIVKNKNNKFKESLTWIPILVNEMASEIKWIDSNFCSSLNQKIILVIFKEIDENQTKIDDFFVITFNEIDKLNAKSVFYQTQIKFNNGGILVFDPSKNKNTYNFVKSNVDEFFHVRPKAKDSSDVYKTQYGEVITKQAFWLNKSTLETKLEEFYKKNNLKIEKENLDFNFCENHFNQFHINPSENENIFLSNVNKDIENKLNKKKRKDKKYKNESIIYWLFERKINTKDIFFKNDLDVILEDLNTNSYNFSVRTKNALFSSNIYSFKELINLTLDELDSIENLGEKSKNEIFSAIEKSIYLDENNTNRTEELEKQIEVFISNSYYDVIYNKQLFKNILCRYLKKEELNNINNLNINKVLINNQEWEKYLQDFVVNKINNDNRNFININDLNNSLSNLNFNIYSLEDFIDYLVKNRRIIKIKNSLFIEKETLENIISKNANDEIKSKLKSKFEKNNDQSENEVETIKNYDSKENHSSKLYRFFDSINDFYEIWFSGIFKTYNFNLESFKFITGWSERIFIFFKYKFGQGEKSILSLCYDIAAPSFIREQASKYKDKYWIRTTNGELVFKKRNDILRFLIKQHKNNEIKFEDFYEKYNSFLKEYNLFNEEFQYLERVLEHKIANAKNVLWKHRKIFRYFEFDSINKDEFVNDLCLEKFHNKEIGTQILLDTTNIKEKYDIRDEYELHNFLKKIYDELNLPFNVSFERMPGLGIGTYNRNEQIKKLMFAEAPIHKEKLAELYSEIYGVKKQNVLANYLDEICKYLNGDIFEIDYIPFEINEINVMKNALNKRYYNLEEIEKIYLSNFSNGDIKKINRPNLDSIGFKITGEHVYKKEFQNLDAVFKSYFQNADKIARVDINFNITATQNVREQILNDYKWLQIDKDTFISNELLFKNTDMNKNDIYDFCGKAIEYSKNKIFTLTSLIKQGFEHKLLDLGFEDFFYESILKRNKKISFRMLGSDIIFREINQNKKIVVASDLISEIIDEKLSMNVYDLIQYIEMNYNININKTKIINWIKESSLYYSEVFDKVFIDKKQYLEEII